MRRLQLLVVLVVSMLVVGGASWAVSRPSTTEMAACVAKAGGAMRMVAATARCKSKERKVTWNVTGPQGVPGLPGTPGASGSTGDKGNIGAPGPQGLKGVQGEAGTNGAIGPAGAQGLVGQMGLMGLMGPAGPPGMIGLMGAVGPAGATGLRGLDGAIGERGSPGADGAVGPRGEQGDVGQTGAPGPRGEPGATGPAGPEGSRGAQGVSGPAGAAGAPGEDGEPGSPGEQGPAGPSGPAGPAVLVSAPVAPGQSVGVTGSFLASITLDKTKNYLVTAGITATASGNSSLQCQLLRNGVNGWDAMAEIDLSARTTVSLEHVYRAQTGISGTQMVVFLACLSADLTYTVDLGHLNALQLTTIQSSGTAAANLRSSVPTLRWGSTP